MSISYLNFTLLSKIRLVMRDMLSSCVVDDGMSYDQSYRSMKVWIYYKDHYVLIRFSRCSPRRM